ncbi:Uncharacterised protein [Mycobacteroides abscessus subsp. abscessus]|nr:Uncharacterised protein [Mycobacteroides abscessus subsp. abscessus]
MLQDLVGTVCRPDVFDAEVGSGCRSEVGGEVATQRDSVTVRVTVQLGRSGADRFSDVGDQLRRRRVRVLVGVENDRNLQLRCAISAFAAQVVAERKIVDGDLGSGYLSAGNLGSGGCGRHLAASATAPENLRVIASPCAGRSSACAKVTTWAETSRSAASS